MAPKKTTQKMSLGDFLSDQSLGPSSSWADEVEEYTSIGTQPLPPTDRPRNTATAWGSSGGDRGYATRERDIFPTRLPDKPPFTAHLGNLSYDATVDSVTDFFTGCSVVSVRIIEDREQQRPKGFAYAEFETVDGLKKALDLDGTPFEGRPMRIKIADPPRGGDRDGRGDMARDLGSWERKGPLPDLPSRNRDFGERRGPSDFGDRGDRRGSRDPVDDGKFRDLGNWERKGPLSPVAAPPAMERQMSRDGSRSRNDFGPRSDSLRGNRKASPATWGEGRTHFEEAPRQSRREFTERPERVPTAAERDTQWRDRMRPDAPAKSPSQSHDGSETPASPAAGSLSPAAVPAAPATRPRLNLQKRTVSEATEITTTPTTTDSKASPFGAARPIDTAAREREVELRRQQAIKEKREADEKAKEERRLAKEKEATAKAEAEAKAAAASAEPATPVAEASPVQSKAADADNAAVAQEAKPAADVSDAAPKTEVAADAAAAVGSSEKPAGGEAPASGPGGQGVPPRPRNGAQDPARDGAPKYTSRAAESGNWRSSGDRSRNGPREPRGGRGGAGPRGPGRNYEGGHRGPRLNGSNPQRDLHNRDQPPATPVASEHPEEDGWTTVTPKDKRRSQGKMMA